MAVPNIFPNLQLMHKDTINKIADALALYGAIIGAAIVAVSVEYSIVGYASYLISSVATFYRLRDTNVSRSIKHQNIFFVFINCVGLIVRLFK